MCNYSAQLIHKRKNTYRNHSGIVRFDFTNRYWYHLHMAKVTHELIGGEWQQVSTPRAPERTNFVIVCTYGDWSGFRTLTECLAQTPASGVLSRGRAYWIEER